jgi:RimJ/RimL family protein N-acetyltransferase
MCGLIRRPQLADVDLGYAFVPEAWGKGYAFEAARAVLEHGLRVLGIPRVVAIVTFENASSIRLLERLGLAFERPIRMNPGDPEIALYALDARR